VVRDVLAERGIELKEVTRQMARNEIALAAIRAKLT
jgi:hypothetical protein